MADGRVLVTADGEVARFLANGHLDTDFGPGGVVHLSGGQATHLGVGADAVYVSVGQKIYKLGND